MRDDTSDTSGISSSFTLMFVIGSDFLEGEIIDLGRMFTSELKGVE